MPDSKRVITNIVEFCIIVIVAFFIGYAVYASLIGVGVSSIFSITASLIAFFVVVVIFYVLIREYL